MIRHKIQNSAMPFSEKIKHKNKKLEPQGILRPVFLYFCVLVSAIAVFVFPKFANADNKKWSGDGDKVSWEDGSNWLPVGKPIVSDSVTVDKKNSIVVISGTFNAHSLLIGGRGSASLSIQDFVSGEVDPQKNTDNALYIKRGGMVTLQGDGQITLKGSFKNTEETSSPEPAFMFSVE